MSSQKTIDNLSNAVITKKNYTFYFSKSLAEDFGRKQIERFGTEQQKLQLQIADKLKAIDEKYDNIDVTNNLQKFALGLARTTEKKDAIDELVGNSKIDFRDDSNKIADGYADGFEKGVRTILETNPLFNILSDSAKQELVNYGVGLGKGTVSLAGSAVGVNNFVRNTFQDLLVSGMENIGIDTSSIKKNLSTSRQSEQQNWSAIMNARTNEMARGDYSITTKNEYGFETKLYDLNWSVTAGDMTAQAVPFLVIGAVTGGASIPIQMVASGATSGAMSLGGNYVQTGDKTASLKTAAWATAQGAMNPLTAKLPFPSDVAANAATGYIFAKLENPNASDADIVQSMILQTAQAGAFKVGSKIHEMYSSRAGRNLSETEVKQRYEKDVSENLKVINDEINKSANQNGQKVVDDIATKLTSDNAKVADNKIQGNAKRAELEAKLSKINTETIQSPVNQTLKKPVFKNGWNNEKVLEIPKGKRPNPSEYLDESYINEHLKKFNEGGGYLTSKDVLDRFGRDTLGRPDGQFIMPKAELDALIKRANGDISIIEKELGIPSGAWQGKEIVRIDIPDAKDNGLRIPSGNEAGTNELWLPGGKLPTGKSEAVINQVTKGTYTETPVTNKK